MSISPHILLVDDEARFAESLQLILLANNYSSIIAPNGSRGLELLEEQTFDLVLLDVDLPDMNGVQIISHIKALFPMMPIIMMTGNATVEIAVTAIKNGAYDFLKKPIDHNTLTVTIEKAISHHLLEKELKASEQRFKTLSEASWEGIVIHENGLLIEANQQFLDIFGYQKDELIGTNVLANIFSGDSYLHVLQRVHEGILSPLETEGTRKGGSRFPLEVRSNGIEFNGQQATVSTVRDITERKNAEQEKLDLQKQLAKASKMEALGLMASSVAHDLNNILSGIVSFPEVVLMDMDPSNKHRESILGMQEAGKRAASVVSDLVSIARGTTTPKAIKCPNSIIRDHLSSIEHRDYAERFPKITIIEKLSDDLLNINCSDIHIKKVLMNLLGNALEALHDEGSITISTENIHLAEPLAAYEKIAAGDYIKITVSDNGEGIDSTDIEHIFDPFYSKKVMDRSGTGLGLAIVWSKVHDHDGYINVKSDIDGTSFEVFIPSTSEVEFAQNPVLSLNALKGAGEVVLVVDDQMTQCVIASNLLKNLGYAPIQAHNGKDAVAICKSTSVDIVLLDMVLDQEMNGREAYEHMLKANLQQRAIVVSGSAEDDEVAKMKSLGATHFVKKPYTVDQLALAVKQSLRNIPSHF